MHGTHGHYGTIAERPALQFERLLAFPVDAVWRAVTDPAELGTWFPAAVSVEPRVGGRIDFAGRDGGPAGEGEVLQLDAPHVLSFSWGGERLHFELEPMVGEGCLLRFTHLLSDPEQAAREAAGWHVCLDVLGRHLAGEPTRAPGPTPTDEWREQYEDYLERGLPSGAPVP
jgi:uncharacterized protein YndB with AHSA1/START domain